MVHKTLTLSQKLKVSGIIDPSVIAAVSGPMIAALCMTGALTQWGHQVKGRVLVTIDPYFFDPQRIA